jgi:hypothetical protein
MIETTYLKILGDTVPDIDTLEVRVVTIVESTAIGFEFVGELDGNQ